MDDRLTDEKWRGMLDDGSAPPPPEWTSTFLVDETEYAELSRSVTDFQKSVTQAYWYRDPVYLSGGGLAAESVTSEIASLTAQVRYMGHQLAASEFRSFDLQSPSKAVVTARETWSDTLYAITEYSPEAEDPVVTQRGPYPLDATYTLEWLDTGQGPTWQVTNVVYASAPPEFE
jgi:hypothetical protein